MSYKARLLVIDDERTNRAILKRSFPDCDVIEAANSQEAILRLSDSRIDVVLLDIMMPGMNGLGLWIVREMADQQKGAVGVECPVDGGSIFWVRLPAVVAVAGV